MKLYKSIPSLLILSACTSGLPQIVDGLMGAVAGTVGSLQGGSGSLIDPASISLRPRGPVSATSDGRIPSIINILPGVNPLLVVRELNLSSLFGTISLITSPVFTGCIGSFSRSTLDRIISKFGNQVQVERDQLISIAQVSTQPDTESWALQHISSAEPTDSDAYRYPESAGSGVPVYVLDSGVYENHPEFADADVKQVLNLVTSEPNTGDLNGHGTHVAGLICSKHFGVAKKAILRAIKILDKDGGGKLSSIILAFNYIATRSLLSLKAIKCIVNMSLTGDKSQILDLVVSKAMGLGIAVITAAGNYNMDACDFSPAGSDGAFAVASIDPENTKTWFTNYGSCVSAAMPGINIPSTYINDTNNQGSSPIKLLSGTSMSSPLMAGVAALYCAEKKFSNVPDLFATLKEDSLAVLKGFSDSTPNRLGSTVKLLETA